MHYSQVCGAKGCCKAKGSPALKEKQPSDTTQLALLDQSDAELKEGDLEDEGKEDELEAILDEDSDEGGADLGEEGHAAGEDVRSSGSSEAGDAEERDAETD